MIWDVAGHWWFLRVPRVILRCSQTWEKMQSMKGPYCHLRQASTGPGSSPSCSQIKFQLCSLPTTVPFLSTGAFIGKDPDAGKDWRQKEKRVERMRWLDGITDSKDMNLSKLLEIVEDRGAVYGVAKNWTRLSGWTTATREYGKEGLQGVPFRRTSTPWSHLRWK